MTKQHNKLAEVVRRAIEDIIAGDLDSEIRENTNIPIESLTQETRDLRPDLTFRRRENQSLVWEIIEFSCTFGYTICNGKTLEHVFQQKQQK
jgi:hypothetical protein